MDMKALGRIVSESTLMPLSVVFAIIAAMYVYHKDMQDLSDRVSRIEGKLGQAKIDVSPISPYATVSNKATSTRE